MTQERPNFADASALREEITRLEYDASQRSLSADEQHRLNDLRRHHSELVASAKERLERTDESEAEALVSKGDDSPD